MKITTFDKVSDLEDRAFGLLREHLGLAADAPHAVMLTGGRTPLGLYRKVRESSVQVDESLHLLITDERDVPLESSESNYGQMQPMVASLGLDDARIMRVHTNMPLEASADRYHHELANFLSEGGRITLGLLGLGADGHVASLFDMVDVTRSPRRYSIAVQRAQGPHRVSVTRELLVATEHLVFLVTGTEKAAIVERIQSDPKNVVAARAVEQASNVELWFAAGVAGLTNGS